MKIGSLFNSITAGIALYSIAQMIFTALTFSYVISFLYKEKIGTKARIIVFAFFALYPPFATYAISMWKDVPFGLCMIYFVIQVYYIFKDKMYLDKKLNILKIIGISISVILFRNNGVYVVMLSFISFIIFNRKYWKKLSLITGCLVVFYVLLKGPIFSVLNITDGPVREALSVPIQQISRTYKYKHDELSDEEKEQIHTWIQNEDIENNYYDLISDNMKDTFNNEKFKSDKVGFVKIWFDLFKKYPKTYFESYLIGSMGYWYPEVGNWVIPDWFDYDANNTLRYNKKPLVKIRLIDLMVSGVNKRKTSIFTLLFNIGFFFWILVTLFGYVIYNKKYKLLNVFVPLLVLWLTTTASPVWCEFRYIYALFTVMPVLLPLILKKVRNES